MEGAFQPFRVELGCPDGCLGRDCTDLGLWRRVRGSGPVLPRPPRPEGMVWSAHHPAFPQCGCWVSTPARWQAVAEEVVGSWTR